MRRWEPDVGLGGVGGIAGFEGFFVVGEGLRMGGWLVEVKWVWRWVVGILTYLAFLLEDFVVVNVLAYCFDVGSGVAAMMGATGWMWCEVFCFEREGEEFLGLWEGKMLDIGYYC